MGQVKKLTGYYEMIEPVSELQIQVGRQRTQTSYQRSTLWADGTAQC